jgi:hypothetical protein
MKRVLMAAIAAVTFTTAVAVAEATPVEAKLINCSKWTSGRQGYGQCSGVNTLLAPYGNQVVVVVICRRPTWLGGGSYQLAGDWVSRNSTSIATCATFYNATDPVLWFR